MKRVSLLALSLALWTAGCSAEGEAKLKIGGHLLTVEVAYTPEEQTPVESKSPRVAYAIETNRDWFASRGLKTGMKVQGLPR